MMNAPDFQSCHAVESSAQRSRSAGLSFGRLTERCRTPIWWRNTRISNWSAERLRNEAASEAIRAVNMCPKGDRTMSDNSQSISAIGVYEKHRSNTPEPAVIAPLAVPLRRRTGRSSPDSRSCPREPIPSAMSLRGSLPCLLLCYHATRITCPQPYPGISAGDHGALTRGQRVSGGL